MAIGFTPCSFWSRSWSSPAIAFNCGSEVPEQMMKKSVKVEIVRRSMATMSSAFLSATMEAQRRARASDLMAWVLVEVVLFDEGAHRFGNEIADGLAARNPAADVGGRDIDPPGK